MGATASNQFWKLRSKHGRDKLFTEPTLLKEAAEEYFNWSDSHPMYEVQAVKSGENAGKLIKVPVLRAYSLNALCNYIGCSESYFRTFKSTAKPDDKDFLTVIEWIENVIYTQQFEGAASNLLNGNIISRKLGLIEKTDVTTNGKEIMPEKSDDELKELLHKTLSKLND